MKVKQVAKLNRENRQNPNQYRVYDPNGIAPCLNTMGGGGLQPHIIMKVKNQTKQGYIECPIGGGDGLGFP